MQEHMKKRHTETIELRFVGPVVNMALAIKTLKPLGFVDTSEAEPWRENYPECSEGQLIGKALAGMRYREGITQVQLSEKTGIPQRHLSEMENGKRPIGKAKARILAKALNTDYRVFL